MAKVSDEIFSGLHATLSFVQACLKELNLDDSPAQSNRNVADRLCLAQKLNEDSEILL